MKHSTNNTIITVGKNYRLTNHLGNTNIAPDINKLPEHPDFSNEVAKKVDEIKASHKNPVGVSAKYSDLLGCMEYNPNGGMATADNIWHDTKWYCKNVPVIVNIDGLSVALNRNPYEQFCYSVAKKWRTNRDWLPQDRIQSPTEIADQESVVGLALIEGLKSGDKEAIIGNCFANLDAFYKSRKQDTHKTMLKQETLWAPERAFMATLFTGDLSTVGGNPIDLTEDCPYGCLTEDDLDALDRLKVLFDAVKEKHKFATKETWYCAQCYALNMPTEDGINTVYGVDLEKAKAKAPKTYAKAVNSAKVKYCKHAKEVFEWVIEEVPNQPIGLSHWLEIIAKAKTEADNDNTNP